MTKAGYEGRKDEKMTDRTRKALDSMRAECLRSIESDNPNCSLECRKAWFYTHTGAIEAAYAFGLIGKKEFEIIHSEWMKHNPDK